MDFSDGRFDPTLPFLTNRLEEVRVFSPDGELKLAPAGVGYSCKSGDELDLVGGHLRYGLFKRGGAPGLLIYDAKGARNLEAAGRILGLEVELLARAEGDELVLTVLDGGKPAAGSEIVVHQDGTLYPGEFETNSEGEARLPMPSSSIFAARALIKRAESGEHEGEAYDQVLRYTTLAIERLHGRTAPEGVDPEAWLRLQGMLLRQERISPTVKEVSGDLNVSIDGQRHQARFRFQPGQPLSVESENLSGESLAWVTERVSSEMARVQARSADEWLAGHKTSFEASRDPLIGQWVSLADGHSTRLRMRDFELKECRQTLEQRAVVTHVLETMESEAGRVLPLAETEVHFDAKGMPAACYSLHRDFQLVEDAYLPAWVECSQLKAEGTELKRIGFEALELLR